MADDQISITCRLCGLAIRGSDHVVQVESFDPPVVHIACAESAHVVDHDWVHSNPETLSSWARGIGCGTAV